MPFAVESEKAWKPPESVSIACGHRVKPWRPPSPATALGAGPQPQVVRVAEHDARARRRDLARRERLHAALRADGHERRRLDVPVRRREHGAPRVSVARDDAEREAGASAGSSALSRAASRRRRRRSGSARSTATRYAVERRARRRRRRRRARASVEQGRWKFVSSPSTTRQAYPGWMRSRVSPLEAGRGPARCGSAALSRARTVVVPTATTGAPRARARAIASAAAGVTTYRSACIGWSSRSCTCTGWNVPSPTCSVIVAISQPRREPIEQRLRQVQPRGRRGDGAVVPRVDGLVALRVLERIVALDVRRQAARGRTPSTRPARARPPASRARSRADRRPERPRRRTQSAGSLPGGPPRGTMSTSDPKRSGLLDLPSARQISTARVCPGRGLDLANAPCAGAGTLRPDPRCRACGRRAAPG